MVISSKKDFSFRTNLPNATFEYVKYPDSFRATLIQLANAAYNAFLSAHSNMNEIQQNMQQVPGHVKTALKLLATAPFPLLEKLLPLSLNNVERIGIECSNLSHTTHNKFADVQLLIGEVTELTGFSSGVTDQKLAETIIELNKTDAAKKAMKEKEAVIQRKYDEQAAKVRDAQNQFNEALKEIPTGLNSIMHQALGAAVDVFKHSLAATICVGGIRKNCMPGPIGSTAEEAANNAIDKAQQAHRALQEAETRYDAIFNELLNHHDNLTQVMVQLASLDMTKIDYEQLIPIFQQAIQYLSEIREHWGRLIEFFDELRIRVQITVKNSFTKFVDWMKTAQGMGVDYLTQEICAFYLDMLKDDVIGIHREAHLLYIIKDGCGASDEERNQLKDELMQDTKMVQAKVSRLAFQRKTEYKEANKQRRHEIETFIQQATIEAIGQKRPTFVKFMNTVDPKFSIMSRRTLSRKTIPTLYTKMNDLLKQFCSTAEYISLTLDIWTNRRTHPFLSVTDKSSKIVTDNASKNIKAFENLIIPGFESYFTDDDENKTDIELSDVNDSDSDVSDSDDDLNQDTAISIAISTQTMLNTVKDSFDNVTSKSELRLPCFAHALQRVVQGGL
ncbi:unnamed protein product [Didymodactylos carnosus]|uniref:Uncharacterized protein n=1 Tax=Didymodactylos carnosus TaxID=1234261 RepID=A0A815FSP3_9BILA|nr:unnamed protein product [Didymodactylos carnosus]CAF4183127.1 unnamed protein product [Didymodactylos carnosus]